MIYLFNVILFLTSNLQVPIINNDESIIINQKIQYADSLSGIGNDKLAIQAYKAALQISLKNDLNEQTAQIYNSLGYLIGYRLQKHDEGIKLLDTAYSYCTHYLAEDHPVIAQYYNNKAIIYGSLRQLDNSLKNFYHALDIFRANYEQNIKK